jgi:hypothetical protein
MVRAERYRGAVTATVVEQVVIAIPPLGESKGWVGREPDRVGDGGEDRALPQLLTAWELLRCGIHLPPSSA